jgi:hypothetical protein
MKIEVQVKNEENGEMGKSMIKTGNVNHLK